MPEPRGPTESERFRLARLALAAALRVPGVVGPSADASGTFITAEGDERLTGVRCVFAGEGYEIALRLSCGLVPLLELGERIRSAVQRAAQGAGIRVADVNVHVADVIGEQR